MKETNSTNGINRGHFFELLDRAHIASTYVQMALGGHPVLARHPELAGLYEEAVARLEDIYQAVGRLDETRLAVSTRPVNMQSQLVTIDPETLGGTPVFEETRVPVAVLFENLADGLTLDEIVAAYPGLPREKAIEALWRAEKLLVSNENATMPRK